VILAVVGTRPEVIKMAPVIHALRRRGLAVQLVATGQHHDVRMMGSFLETFALRVDHALTLAHRDLFGSFVEILGSLGPVFRAVAPRLALAVGDTTTVLATALAARKTGCAFGHVEAGLRAFSRDLPEEEHRICADAIGDLLFAPTRIAAENLAREHVNGKVIVSGNPILDALRSHAPVAIPADRRAGILVTLHRQETVDDPRRLAQVVEALRILANSELVDWPLHPRTRAKLAELAIPLPRTIKVTEPIGHTDFLARLAHARLVVTDSGGVQEEAAIIGTPCVCVRDHTERPETIAAGVGLRSGTETTDILEAVHEILGAWESFARPVPYLYGDGHAGDKIAEACASFLAEERSLPHLAARTSA
jgi:UDP-N-acetylglucosamine 2-epimerase (non-hydrolysing)